MSEAIPGLPPAPAPVTPRDAEAATWSSGPLTFDDLIPEPAPAQVARYAEDIGRSVVSGLDEGMATIAGMPAWLALKAQKGISLGQSYVQGRPFEEVEAENDKNALISRRALEPYTPEAFHQGSGLAHKPETTAGEYAHTAASFVPAAVLAPVVWRAMP